MKRIIYRGVIVSLVILNAAVWKLSLAWWSIIYPESVYEAGVFEEEQDDQKDDEESGDVRVQFLFTKWLHRLMEKKQDYA